MARLPRLTLPGHPHHVIQRGNNRQPVFVDPADRQMLLDLAGSHAAHFGIAWHGYVLMDSQFHLLATPAGPEGLPRWMQALGRSYVRYFNDRHRRSGTLWDGRFRSALVQADRYSLACLAYFDLAPVRAGLVEAPLDYPWSSHAHYVGVRPERPLAPPPQFWALGNTPFEREAAYADLVRRGLPQSTEHLLTQSATYGWAAGDADYLAALQHAAARPVAKRPPGRRRAAGNCPEG